MKDNKEINLQNKDLYTVPEVARIIGRNNNETGELLNSGLLPYLKLGHRKVRRTALLAFLEKYEGWDITDPYKPRKLD